MNPPNNNSFNNKRGFTQFQDDKLQFAVHKLATHTTRTLKENTKTARIIEHNLGHVEILANMAVEVCELSGIRGDKSEMFRHMKESHPDVFLERHSEDYDKCSICRRVFRVSNLEAHFTRCSQKKLNKENNKSYNKITRQANKIKKTCAGKGSDQKILNGTSFFLSNVMEAFSMVGADLNMEAGIEKKDSVTGEAYKVAEDTPQAKEIHKNLQAIAIQADQEIDNIIKQLTPTPKHKKPVEVASEKEVPAFQLDADNSTEPPAKTISSDFFEELEFLMANKQSIISPDWTQLDWNIMNRLSYLPGLYHQKDTIQKITDSPLEHKQNIKRLSVMMQSQMLLIVQKLAEKTIENIPKNLNKDNLNKSLAELQVLFPQMQAFVSKLITQHKAQSEPVQVPAQNEPDQVPAQSKSDQVPAQNEPDQVPAKTQYLPSSQEMNIEHTPQLQHVSSSQEDMNIEHNNPPGL